LNPENPVVKLCAYGSRSEFEGQIEEARVAYQRAWEIAGDDYEKCIAAHYMARYQENPLDSLKWNLLALNYADQVEGEEIKSFYPSLYLNLGRCYEVQGDLIESKMYYEMASSLGVDHQPGPNNRWWE
jgi:tetratricopeptide (TPR) repeat protein